MPEKAPAMNRLQRYKYFRFLIVLAIHASAVVLVVGAIMATPRALASGEDANPTGAPGFGGTPPVGAYAEMGSCTDSTTCPNWMWYAGINAFTGAGPYSCAATTDSTDLFEVTGPGGYGGTHAIIRRGTPLSGNGTKVAVACWTGSSWTNANSIDNISPGVWDRVLLSKIAVLSEGTFVSSGYTPDKNNGDYIFSTGGNITPPASLVVQANRVNSNIGQVVTMSGAYANLDFDPTYLLYRRDVLDTKTWQISGSGTVTVLSTNPADPVTTADLNATTPPTSLFGSITSSFSFTHKFSYGGTFDPSVVLSNCTAANLYANVSGCKSITASFTNSPLSIAFPPNNFNNYFNGVPNTVKIGDPVNFNYKIDPALCRTRGVPQRAIFYSGENIAVTHGSGALLSSGSTIPLTGYFTYRYRSLGVDNSGVAYPSIGVVCALDVPRFEARAGGELYSTDIIYIGGDDRAATAGAITIKQTSYIVVPPSAANFVNGGTSTGFATGTGHNISFFSDKYEARQLEQINFKIQYFVPYAVASVELHPDITFDVANPPVIGTGSSVGKVIYYSFSYGSPGVMKPFVLIKSTAFDVNNPSTYDIFYLGGSTNPAFAKEITVTNEQISYNANFFTNRGVFGFDPSTFNFSFGKSDNIFLKFAFDVVNYAIKGALYVASYAFSLVENAPVVNYITNTVVPAPNRTYVLPSKLFTVDMPAEFAGHSFTVTYATGPDAEAFGLMFSIIIFFALFWTIFTFFFKR